MCGPTLGFVFVEEAAAGAGRWGEVERTRSQPVVASNAKVVSRAHRRTKPVLLMERFIFSLHDGIGQSSLISALQASSEEDESVSYGTLSRNARWCCGRELMALLPR
jgi:hypothetical protein